MTTAIETMTLKAMLENKVKETIESRREKVAAIKSFLLNEGFDFNGNEATLSADALGFEYNVTFCELHLHIKAMWNAIGQDYIATDNYIITFIRDLDEITGAIKEDVTSLINTAPFDKELVDCYGLPNGENYSCCDDML